MNTNNFTESGKSSPQQKIKLKQKKKKIFTNLSPNVESKTNTDKLFLTKKLKFNNRSFAKDRNTTNNIKFVVKTRGSIGESKMNLTNKNMNNYTTIKDLIAKNIPYHKNVPKERNWITIPFFNIKNINNSNNSKKIKSCGRGNIKEQISIEKQNNHILLRSLESVRINRLSKSSKHMIVKKNKNISKNNNPFCIKKINNQDKRLKTMINKKMKLILHVKKNKISNNKNYNLVKKNNICRNQGRVTTCINRKLKNMNYLNILDEDNNNKSSSFKFKYEQKSNSNIYTCMDLIKSYHSILEKNSYYHETMEDYIIEDFSDIFSCFGIFDGHGGTEIPKYLSENFFKTFQKNYNKLKNNKKNIKNIILNTFSDLDNQIIKKIKNADMSGSTGTVVLINNISKNIYCANIGDSRCYYINDKNSILITQDHNCKNEEEANRVRGSGGQIFLGRVYGSLILTRSFGDNQFKDQGVISVPYIKIFNLDNVNINYIVLASDGIWDVVDDKLLFKISKDFKNSKDFCEYLVDYALKSGSRDNISCIVLKL